MIVFVLLWLQDIFIIRFSYSRLKCGDNCNKFLINSKIKIVYAKVFINISKAISRYVLQVIRKEWNKRCVYSRDGYNKKTSRGTLVTDIFGSVGRPLTLQNFRRRFHVKQTQRYNLQRYILQILQKAVDIVSVTEIAYFEMNKMVFVLKKHYVFRILFITLSTTLIIMRNIGD
jgi:hypothetical protein